MFKGENNFATCWLPETGRELTGICATMRRSLRILGPDVHKGRFPLVDPRYDIESAINIAVYAVNSNTHARRRKPTAASDKRERHIYM
jgi:hypothetical protein